MFPPQHASPGSPHAHVCEELQVKLVLQIDPAQQGWLLAPQGTHIPLTHCFPTPHGAAHVAIMLLSPPLLPSVPESPPVIIIMPSVPGPVPSLPPASGCAVIDASGSWTGIDE
jgi:hypothetical protein